MGSVNTHLIGNRLRSEWAACSQCRYSFSEPSLPAACDSGAVSSDAGDHCDSLPDHSSFAQSLHVHVPFHCCSDLPIAAMTAALMSLILLLQWTGAVSFLHGDAVTVAHSQKQTHTWDGRRKRTPSAGRCHVRAFVSRAVCTSDDTHYRRTNTNTLTPVDSAK